MAIGIQDLQQTAYGKYYKIHDKDREQWYYSEWFIGCLLMWALDMGGIDNERWI